MSAGISIIENSIGLIIVKQTKKQYLCERIRGAIREEARGCSESDGGFKPIHGSVQSTLGTQWKVVPLLVNFKKLEKKIFLLLCYSFISRGHSFLPFLSMIGPDRVAQKGENLTVSTPSKAISIAPFHVKITTSSSSQYSVPYTRVWNLITATTFQVFLIHYFVGYTPRSRYEVRFYIHLSTYACMYVCMWIKLLPLAPVGRVQPSIPHVPNLYTCVYE